MATKLEQYAEIQALVQKEARAIAEQVYKENATKYGVASVPLHRHNGADSPILRNGSIGNFVALPSFDSVPPSGDPGVLSPTNLGNQTVNTVVLNASGNQNPNPPNVFVMPIPVIYASSGVGPGGSFNLGEAPQGTLLFFANPSAALSNLWVKTIDGWYSIDANLGPL